MIMTHAVHPATVEGQPPPKPLIRSLANVGIVAGAAVGHLDHGGGQTRESHRHTGVS